MSVLIFAETWEGKFKKSTYEAVSYGARVAKEMGTEAIAAVLGNLTDDAAILGKYGAAKVLVADGGDSFNNAKFGTTLAKLANEQGAKTIVIAATNNGKMLATAAAVHFDAALITNATALPSSTSPLTVRRSVFSAKGLADYKSNSDKNVISIVPNAIGVAQIEAAAAVEKVSASTADVRIASISSVDRVKGKIPLPEAELVVSAGRGMKAPENWNLIEDLADALGAATACSKPVSDIGWRPHSEHVGQTGIQINPNLYIAVGISGAIQHLAGVSASKTIVVINSDPEAPFFKAANYGIVGDAFEIVPKLTEAIKAFKAHH